MPLLAKAGNRILVTVRRVTGSLLTAFLQSVILLGEGEGRRRLGRRRLPRGTGQKGTEVSWGT